MTKAEFMLWQKLKGKQLEGVKFRSQYGVVGSLSIFIVLNLN
jgi:very-short-patch-repair endonuclease